MKAYKLEIIVIDFQNYGPDEIIHSLDCLRNFNVDVVSTREADIGEWDDSHPLNLTSTSSQEKLVYFDIKT